MESNNATYDQVIILRFVILRRLWFYVVCGFIIGQKNIV